MKWLSGSLANDKFSTHFFQCAEPFAAAPALQHPPPLEYGFHPSSFSSFAFNLKQTLITFTKDALQLRLTEFGVFHQTMEFDHVCE